MKSSLQLLAVLGTLTAACVAHAVPTAFYDRNSGRIFLQNDTPFPLVFELSSESGRLTGEPNPIPVSFPDGAHLPFSLSYADVIPTGPAQRPDLSNLHDVGTMIPGGGPVGDLAAQTLHLSGTNTVQSALVIEVPEPTTLAAAAFGSMVLLGTARVIRSGHRHGFGA